MSVEERVERIRAEQKADVESRNRLIEVKKAEFSTYARFVNTRLEQLRDVGVVGIIEKFVKHEVSPIFIPEDYIKEESAPDPIPGPKNWPTAAKFRHGFHEGYKPKDFWTANLLPPRLDNQTLEWNTNLQIKLEHRAGEVHGSMVQTGSVIGWVDLIWETSSNFLSVEGSNQAYRYEVTEITTREFPYYLDKIEDVIAHAVINPKRPEPRVRYFDRNTPIGAQA